MEIEKDMLQARRRGKARESARWSAWAAALLDRHRRLGARTHGLATVLAKPRAAGRILRERWLLSSRTLLPRIHLSIQPLLRLSSLRQTGCASPAPAQTFVSVSTAFSRTAPAAAPLALVLQRLREPGRAMATRTGRRAPEGAPARPALARHLASKVRREERAAHAATVRVVARTNALTEQSGREPATPWGSEPAAPPRAADPWRGTQASTPAPVQAPAVNVEALTERVMQQIDRRLHSWRERRGGF
jgi:hypothetical protein